jgi:hypothetical protein
MSLLARTNTFGNPLRDFFGSNLMDDFFDEGWPGAGQGFGGIMPFRNVMPETSSMLTTPTFSRRAVYAPPSKPNRSFRESEPPLFALLGRLDAGVRVHALMMQHHISPMG